MATQTPQGPELQADTDHGVERAALARLLPLVADLPDVQVISDPRPVFQVADKTFIFFREPRKDAVDEAGDLLPDVICIYVPDLDEKDAWIAECEPLFTTPHFNGHRSVLLRASRIDEVDEHDLIELVRGAWLARAPKRLAKEWSATHLNAG